MNILLIATYELGRQSFGLASAAAWLEREGMTVQSVDSALTPLPAEHVEAADLIAFYLPMHTATRLAAELIETVKLLNSDAHICCVGLYAPVNESFLRRIGADSILGGEFEEGLLSICRRLGQSRNGNRKHPGAEAAFQQVEPVTSLNRQNFIIPQREGLPPLSDYAQLCCNGKPARITGYTETTRGCKYLCRHCPVVPVYQGKFRVVQQDVVMEDIRQQVEAGAAHITFGDPDFFNGPGHVLPIVEALHNQFPEITYDVTIKIEHLLKHQQHLPVLKSTGCAIITSAVESADNQILDIFDKGHTREDFIEAAALLESNGLVLNPTFVTFTPWTTLENYRDLLRLIHQLGLVSNVSPVQYAIRLLIPNGSRLLEWPGIDALIGDFNESRLTYEWQHQDPKVDKLFDEISTLVTPGHISIADRRSVFLKIWKLVHSLIGEPPPDLPEQYHLDRTEIPYLNEPWYC